MVDLEHHITDLDGGCSFEQTIQTGTAGDTERAEIISVSGAGTTTATDGRLWECPRGTLGDNEYCVFHLSPDERATLDIGQDAVTDAFVTTVQCAGANVKQLLGARLDGLDLDHQQLSAPDNYPIDLRYATIGGELSLTNADLRQPLHCGHATLDGLTITNSRVIAGCHFEHAQIRGDVLLGNQIDCGLVFREATIEGDFEAVPAIFDRGINCTGTTFHGDLEFYADFNDEPNFTDAVVHGATTFFVDVNADSYFEDATFKGPFDLYAAFTGSARFNRATFRDQFDFYGRVDADAHFSNTVFEGPAAFYRTGEEGRATRFYQFANFDGATFETDVDFTRVEFVGSADFEGTTFRGFARLDETRFERRTRFIDISFSDTLSFRNTVFTGTPVFDPTAMSTRRLIDFTATQLIAGRIHIDPGDPILFDLTRAYVGDVRIEGLTDGSVFDHFLVNRTEFDGFDFSAHRLELARRNYVIHEPNVSDARPCAFDDGETYPDDSSITAEDLEVTYMKAKNGAKAIDENEAVSQFFLREMHHRRHRHLQTVGVSGDLRGSLRAAGRAVTNLVMGLTCGYGERPWRVVGSSVGIVAIFAALYMAIGVSTSYDPAPIGYIILSIETFVALVLGSPRITNPTVNLLTSIEAFSGAYFIALFVFTLTRSIRR